MSALRTCLASAALWLLAVEARAQQPAAPSVEAVIVTAPPASGLRTSIDRRSYSVAEDLQARTGSIGEALRSIPSVEVDVQGNVSLRGDPSVTIMIDGKPSGMFSGPGAADALQQLPADQIERVEVITNPSAAFKADGSGGIINLVTRQARGAGASGSARVNLGDGGRYNGGVSGAYNSRSLTLSGDAGYRHDLQKNDLTDRRTGTASDSLQTSATRGVSDLVHGRAEVEYDPDDATRLSGELRFNRIEVDSRTWERFATNGTLRDRVGGQGVERSNAEASASFRRRFGGEGHELTLDLSRERTDFAARRATVETPGLHEATRVDQVQDETDLEVEYSRPLPGEAKLKAGYELEIEDADSDRFGARGPSPSALVMEPSLTNRFLYEQRIHTLYGTYERPLGDVTVLAGMRLEQADVDTDQRTSGLKGGHGYSRAYPSLHLSWRLDDEQQLSLSYSHRVQRPRGEDLNPYRVYVDPFNFREGNPRLEPQDTDSFELGYQRRAGQAYYLATLYYRQSRNGVTDVVRDLGGGVFLTTRANLSESRSGGLELTANGRITSKLSYNLTGNAYWNEIDASRLGVSGARSAYALGGRANLTWQAGPDDLFQLNAGLNAKRLTAQGHRRPFGVVNLGYRRRFDDRVSAVVTVQDLLSSARDRQVLDTPALRGVSERRYQGRAVFVGLTYAFGGSGKRPRDPGFEFEAGAAPQP